MGDFDYVKVGRADAPEPFSVADLIASMTDMEDEYAAFVGCFYGDPGTRKTVRAMQLAQRITPADKKILYVYTGQGWSSLKNHKEENLMARTKKMPFIRYEQIETLQATLMNPSIREKMNIGTIVFDEYNRMQDMDIDALTKHRAHLVNTGPKRKDKDGIEIYKDPDTPEWPEYNTTKVRMINLMNDLLMLDELNTIFVCHTKLQKKTGKIEPDFPQATASAFISMVHSIYYCDKVEDINSGRVSFPIELVSGGQTVSKNRIGGLGRNVSEVQPIADAFIAWNADVLEKKGKKSSLVTPEEKSSPAPIVGEPVTESVAEKVVVAEAAIVPETVTVPVEENRKTEAEVVTGTIVAGPDDKDSIIAAPTEVPVTSPALGEFDFNDLFNS